MRQCITSICVYGLLASPHSLSVRERDRERAHSSPRKLRLSSAPPSLTPSRTPSTTPSFSVTPSVSITPSVTPSISVTPSVTATPSVSRTPSISFTPNASISVTPSVTPTITPSVSRTPSITPSVSLTPIIGSTLAQLGLTPCFLESSGFPIATADNILLPVGNTDISQIAGVAGKYLYRSYGQVWTTITASRRCRKYLQRKCSRSSFITINLKLLSLIDTKCQIKH